MGRGKQGYEKAWHSFFLVANKFFRNSDGTPIILGGLSVQSDTTHVTVRCYNGVDGNDDEGVYEYEMGLTSVEGMRTGTPFIPPPGIAMEGGMLVDIGASPGVSVLYKGDHE